MFHLAECDTIHDQSLRLIEEALNKIRSKVTEEHELTKVERERRKAEMARILKTCRDLSTPSGHASSEDPVLTTPPHRDQSLPLDRTHQNTPGGMSSELPSRAKPRPKSPESPLAKKLKKNNVAVDIVCFGDGIEEPDAEGKTVLKSFVEAANSGDNSYVQ